MTSEPARQLQLFEPPQDNDGAESQAAAGQARLRHHWLWLLLLILALAGLIGLIAWIKSLRQQDTAAIAVLPVETQRVEPVNRYQTTRTYTGSVRALQASELGFERGGEVIALLVDEGDDVEAGDAIARLETNNLQAQRAEVEAQQQRAMAQLRELENGPRPERIAAAAAAVQNIREELQLARLQQERRQSLYAAGAIAREQLDEVTTRVDALEARLSEAQSTLNELENGTRVEQLQAQRARVRQLQARAQDLEITLAESTLRAPFSGRISRRLVDAGVVVGAGEPVVRLVEAAVPEVAIGVPATVAADLQPGSQQQVQVNGQPYSARIISILPEVDAATRTQTVILALESAAAGAVEPDQVVRWSVTQSVAREGFWLPTTALSSGDKGLWSAYVLAAVADPPAGLEPTVDPDQVYRIEQHALEVLYTEGDRALVRGTLEPRDRIVVSGLQRVTPGQFVRPK
ncbi:ABC exporter membrane fusion protein, DevB family [Halomicronema hongdechloris C2206]|uniref:ABC exporter membrane fusion protein, DevB family n=1 Tax=Halomicronema hongdechloris C2206 TaxID=1641165 RepID=A0A1Z3HT48_9CYAN|nr:efflux RND transporter periplasmic adaptor subunit [Halomicronema hongdechloris]ASC73501.1 ABC exporter membrane fusion protein, DevB family [Halomicronema hongdechloris C2206]